MKSTPFGTTCAVIAFGVLAASAAVAQTTTPTETIAPSTCKKPVMPSKVRRADDTTDFQQKVDDYQTCVKSYADAQSAMAKAHITAANGAINDLNEFVKEVNDAQNNK